MLIRHILHIDLDSFFVSVERSLNPDLGHKPVVVGGNPNSRGVVSCASYEARAYGLKAGMPLVTAHRLCPHAIFLTGSHSRYRDASAKFLNILADFTPDIEPLGLEEAYLDLTGFEPLYGPTLETAYRIKKQIKDELGLTASIGIANSKIVSKIASALSKPDGLIKVIPGEERIFLDPLPVAKLPYVGNKTERILHRIGIDTIGDINRVPVSFLKHTLGTQGEALHRYANGIDSRRVGSIGSIKSISRETTFSEDISNRTIINASLHYLSERVGAELRAQNMQARCVTLKLRYADFETITRSSTLKEAIDADRLIFDTGYVLLKNALERRPVPIRLVGIGVSHLIDGKQLNMLDPWITSLDRLNSAIDCIRKKYGFTSIEVGRTLPLKNIYFRG